MIKKSVLLGLAMLSVAPLSFSHSDENEAEDNTIMEKVIGSVSVTGANSFCGKSIFKFPAPFPADLQLKFMGEFDSSPNATDAIPLSSENCNADTILASTTDPGFVALLGGEDADARLKNRKLRNVPTFLSPDGVRRVIPRTSTSDAMFPPVKVNGAKDITLGQWVKAKGRMKVSCSSNNTSKFKIKLNELLPDSLYSVWGMYATVFPGQSQPQLIPVPLGGVPNAVATDKHGRGSFERTLNGCPLKVLSDGSELMMVIINYHADGIVYGGDPDTSTAIDSFMLEDGEEFQSTHPAGIFNQDQVIFPVRLLEYQ